MSILSLPQEIHAATRHDHARLNRLIIARLPLALPPHVHTPHVYATGLLPFARIYITFEAVWCSLLDGKSSLAVGDAHCDRSTRSGSERLHSVLATLYMPDLQRSERLKGDLEALWGRNKLDAPLRKLFSRQTEGFTHHIQQSVVRKPHIILAYAWVMYMALFNGGRWMRSQLLDAGEAFWNRSRFDDASNCPIAQVGLGFFHFSGTMDGEDTKEEFKRRFLDAETSLSTEERVDIVVEAVEIFTRCRMLVEELDEKLAASVVALPNDANGTSSYMPTSQLLLKHVLPLGLAETVALLLSLLSAMLIDPLYVDHNKQIGSEKSSAE